MFRTALHHVLSQGEIEAIEKESRYRQADDLLDPDNGQQDEGDETTVQTNQIIVQDMQPVPITDDLSVDVFGQNSRR